MKNRVGINHSQSFVKHSQAHHGVQKPLKTHIHFSAISIRGNSTIFTHKLYIIRHVKPFPYFFSDNWKTITPVTLGQATHPALSAIWLSPDSRDQVSPACPVQPVPLCQGPCFGSHHGHLLCQPQPPETLPYLDPREAFFTKCLSEKLWFQGDCSGKSTKIGMFPLQQKWKVGNLVTNSAPLKPVILKFNNKCQLCF